MNRIPEGAKLIAYVLSARDLSIKDLLEFEEYDFKVDSEFSGKSQIVIHRQPEVSQGDFVLCQADGANIFTGICDTYKSGSDSATYTLTIRQKECLFDRFIFIDHEEIIERTGIEDFIANAIELNWRPNDPRMDMPYMTVTADTHTRIRAKVSSIVTLTDGAYNLKTFLGNARELYGIYVDFDFSTAGTLAVNVYHSDAEDVSVDATLSDVTEYSETYSVDALAKLHVLWKEAEDAPGHPRTFYLKTDRTITTDPDDPDRADGSVRSMVIETESESEMEQQVQDAFAKNSYTHKISFLLYMGSKLYDYSEFYPGHSTQIKTKSGIRNTIVTGLTVSSSARFAQITFGKLKVTLIEKLRDRT